MAEFGRPISWRGWTMTLACKFNVFEGVKMHHRPILVPSFGKQAHFNVPVDDLSCDWEIIPWDELLV